MLLEINNSPPTIIALSETWLNTSIPDSIVNIDNYILFRDDRLTHRGGGVCIYVNKSLINDKFNITQLDFSAKPYDSLWIKFESEFLNFVIGCVYRPPINTILNNEDNDKNLLKTIQTMQDKFQNIFLLGDFNYPSISWNSETISANTTRDQLFVDFLLESNFTQLIKQPTRFRTGHTPNLLDLLLTTDVNSIDLIDILNPIGVSDHSTIKFNLQFLLYHEKKEEVRTFVKTDFNELNKALSQANWNFTNSGSPQGQWDNFSKTTRSYIATCTKVFTKKLNLKKPWIGDHLLKKIKYKKKLWKKFKQNPNNDILLQHSRFSNQLKDEIRDAKNKYEHSILDKPKAFYSYVRKHIASKVSVPLVRRADGNLCSSFMETADTLAEAFASTYNLSLVANVCPVMVSGNVSRLSDIDFSPLIVEKHLKQLSVDTAPGPDQLISAKLLKNCATSLSLPLSNIMTSSFKAGELPTEWLTATVTPLYKSGDKLDPANYRPVSLTSITCKVMEKIIVKELLAHMLKNKLIPEQQHGFLPNRSVLTNLLHSTDIWTRIIDNGQPLDIIYLDFSKAFDKVPHRLLLAKLQKYGIEGHLLKWIEAFLSNRSFSVRVGKDRSALKSVVSGVPQGSVLGPILFLLYTSDLLLELGDCYSAYADDIKVFGNPHAVDIQNKLNIIVNWSKIWGIPLNISKCCVLHCGSSNPLKKYYLNTTELTVKTSQKDLGIIVTNTLSWTDQCMAATSKARKILYLLRHVFSNPSFSLVSKLYVTYIRPHIEFAIPVWRPHLIKDFTLLERVQHEVTRWPTKLGRLNYQTRLDLLGLAQLNKRYDRADLIQLFRITHDLFPTPSNYYVELCTDNRLRGHEFKIRKEPFKTTVRKHYLTNRTFDLWNGLSRDIVLVDKVYKFKKRLDKA